MSKRALVVLAEGAEEMETVITVDVLRRAGITVIVGGLSGEGVVCCSRQVLLKPDQVLDDALKTGDFDAIILPGGMGGAKALAGDSSVGAALKDQEKAGRICAAICAAPIAFKAHGIATGKTLTSHPVAKADLEGSYKYSEERVVEDGNIITSRGPGTAMEFALKLVEVLCGPEKVAEIVPPMLIK